MRIQAPYVLTGKLIPRDGKLRGMLFPPLTPPPCTTKTSNKGREGHRHRVLKRDWWHPDSWCGLTQRNPENKKKPTSNQGNKIACAHHRLGTRGWTRRPRRIITHAELPVRSACICTWLARATLSMMLAAPRIGDRSDWTTGVLDNGNDWRKFRAVPRSYPLRSLVLYFV